MRVACLLLFCFWLVACVPEPEDRARAARPDPVVVVAPVEFSSEMQRVEAVGTSRANRSITLFPAVSGEVVKVRFQSGQYVEAGDVLLELDQRDQKLAVELAEVRLAEAQRLFERYQESAATGATLPTVLDAARTELDAARIALDRARISLDDIDVGDRIQTSTAITTLDDRSTLLVSFSVPEMMSGKISVGDDVAISTWSVNDAKALGEVIDIDSRINPDTRTFITRARINNQKDDLRPGMSFRVVLELAGDSFPKLAEISLQWGADGSYVWLVRDGKVSRMPVDIVQRQKGKVLVETNLAAGDLIVVEGIQRLRPGIAVNAMPAETGSL
jgi:membrane fusion protein (multidrug efflux system)